MASNEKKVSELERHGITEESIKSAERVLIDNGIEEDEVQSVLQAVGYTLLDVELYPEDL